MWSSKEYLRCCDQLFRAGVRFPLKVGARVARGFADLGFEEFLLLSENRLFSLYNGKGSVLEASHKDFFMVVPSFEELIDLFLLRGITISQLEFKEQRDWVVHLNTEAQQAVISSHRELLCALAIGLHEIARRLNET